MVLTATHSQLPGTPGLRRARAVPFQAPIFVGSAFGLLYDNSSIGLNEGQSGTPRGRATCSSARALGELAVTEFKGMLAVSLETVGTEVSGRFSDSLVGTEFAK